MIKQTIGNNLLQADEISILMQFVFIV